MIKAEVNLRLLGYLLDFKRLCSLQSIWQFSIVVFPPSTQGVINNRQKLKENGVKLISATENIPDTPEGTLIADSIMKC